MTDPSKRHLERVPPRASGQLLRSAPLTDRRARTRRRLLRAAATVFAAKSVPKATVEDVLQEAGLSRRTFYQLFSDKIDLLAALYESSVEHLYQLTRASASEGASAVDRMTRGIDVYFGFQSTAGPVVQALASEALRPESPLGALRRTLIDRLVDLYRQKIFEAEGRRIDPWLLRALVIAPEAMGLFVLGETAGTPQDVEHARRVLHRIIERVLAPQASQRPASTRDRDEEESDDWGWGSSPVVPEETS